MTDAPSPTITDSLPNDLVEDVEVVQPRRRSSCMAKLDRLACSGAAE